MTVDDMSEDLARMYFQHQYDRFNRIETGNFTVTGIVISVSIGALAFGYKEFGSSNLSFAAGIILPVVILLANVFSVAFTRRGYQYMRRHQLRAKEILRVFAPKLHEFDSVKPNSGSFDWGSRKSMQTWLHMLIILAALAHIVLYSVQ